MKAWNPPDLQSTAANSPSAYRQRMPSAHAAGASNGHIWVKADPGIRIWMTRSIVSSSHGDDEQFRLDSLKPYDRLIYRVLQLPKATI